MATEVNQLVQHLDQLQTTNFADPIAARAHNVNAEALLNLILDIGREKILYTDEQKQTIANKLVAAIRPIQVNIQNHAFEFNPKINKILEKRSALQFLLDDYKNLTISEGTLSDLFEKVKLKETVQILDEIIQKNRKESSDKELIRKYKEEFGSDSDDESAPELDDIPPSHSWWF